MPAKPLYSQQDFNYIPPLNLVVPVVAGDVAANSQTQGLIYRNSQTGILRYVRDSSTVVDLDIKGRIVDADIAAGAAIALSKLAVNPLARANHTGQQTASTISDFDSQVRTTRLDQLAAPTNPVNFNGQRGAAAADATQATDLTTLQQVQNLVSAARNNTDYKDSAKVAVGSNVSISSPGSTLDGVGMAAGDPVLLYGQTAASENGLYVFNGASVAMTRRTDADTNTEMNSGMTVPITEGSKADTLAMLTTDGAITIGTTGLAFIFLSVPTAYVAGTGITISGNTISLQVPVTVGLGGTGASTAAGARTNLNTPQKGFAADVPTLTAGVAVNIAHNLGTQDVVIRVYRKSDGLTADITTGTPDTNNVMLQSDIAVANAVLRVVVEPIA